MEIDMKQTYVKGKDFAELLNDENYYEDGVMTIIHNHHEKNIVWVKGQRNTLDMKKHTLDFNRFLKHHKIVVDSIDDVKTIYTYCH